MVEIGPVPVAEVIAEVGRRLRAGPPAAVTEYLNTRRVRPESLAPYLHRHDAHYTRNLIHRDRDFELLALCWGVGHRAWIHNHRGQRCWMAVTEGALRVRNYRRLYCDQLRRTVRLEPADEVLAAPGRLAAVDPDEPVHAVWNPAELGRPAVSLHVYARPFDSCVAYDADAGVCRDVPLSYTSEHGVRTDRHPGRRDLPALAPGPCELSPAEQVAHCGAAMAPCRGGAP